MTNSQQPANKTPTRILNRIKPISKDKQFLIKFLSDLTKLESHCRKNTGKLYLEPQWQSINDLYRFYGRECADQKFEVLNHTTFR